MKFMVHHLTGSLLGQTQYFDSESLRFGTESDCEVQFNPEKDGMVAEHHAELRVEDSHLTLRDLTGNNEILINNRKTGEAAVHDGDLIQFGENGPLIRFRLLPAAAGASKPWRYIVADSQDIVVRTPHRRYTSILHMVGHVVTDIARYGSPTLKILAVLLILIPLIVIVSLGVSLYYEYRAATISEQRIAELISQIETGRMSRAELEERVIRERTKVEELRRAQDQLKDRLRNAVEEREEARRSKEELNTIREQLSLLESGQRFAEDIIGRFEPGVGLIQGGYAVKETASGRPLRYLGFDEKGKPLLDEKGNPAVTLGGNSPQLVIFWAGTGFLIDSQGTVLTNRHIARFWEFHAAMKPLLQTGFEAVPQFLRIFFPDSHKPYRLQELAVSEGQDLAILSTAEPPTHVTTLQVASPEEKVRIGEPVIILSYQGTFDSILSRLPQTTAEKVIHDVGSDPIALPERLSQDGLIRPLATQGHVTDVSHDIVTYEARAVGGSSGGPVLNRNGRVIAVNHSELVAIGGMNLGVPMDFIRDQLARIGRLPKTSTSATPENHSSEPKLNGRR